MPLAQITLGYARSGVGNIACHRPRTICASDQQRTRYPSSPCLHLHLHPTSAARFTMQLHA